MSIEFEDKLIGTEGKNVIVPEPSVLPDGMFECPRCKQTFSERDRYEDHYVRAHT